VTSVANDAVEAAEAAAAAAVGAAQASAAEGEANASLAFALSQQILQDDDFAAIIPLDLLVAKIIGEGLARYDQVDAAKAAAFARASAAGSAATRQSQETFAKLSAEIGRALQGRTG
jgi:hypothetical protein